MPDPFRIAGPAVISFSGGRTPRLPLDETMHELGEACDSGCGV
jgi:hypothetical protein